MDPGIVRLAEGRSPGGFAVFLPVYRTNASIATVQQRQRALVGFVHGPFNAESLQRELSLAVSPSVAFTLFPAIERTAPPVGSNVSAPDRPRFTAARRVDIAGQQWHLDIRSMESDGGGLPLVARGCLAAGLLISLMVFAVTRAQAASWAAHARHASELQEYAAALRRSEAELRRAVALEREARAIAQTADRAKDEFLAVLSHELRTPLNAVLGWTAMLRQGAVAKERQATALEVIARNARLQAQLVEDLLDVSRIAAGTLRIERSVVTVTPIVEAALESLRPVARAKHIDLVVSMPDEDKSIDADATRVQQIVSNVLGNAIKFTPEGGRVFLELDYDERNVVMRVRDTGIGIAPEFLRHIFEPFRQADTSTTRVHGGVGLGLAIVRRLVEMHGGTIDAHSDPVSKGALFTVRLPLDEGAPVPSSAGTAASANEPDACEPHGHVDLEHRSTASIGAGRCAAIALPL
jgi:signal transduction histidine kinase